MEKGLASKVVKDLMEDYQGLHHRPFVDNFYPSHQLFKDLSEAVTLTCGIVRSNTKGFPVAIKGNVDRNDSLFHRVNMVEHFMTAVHWKDKRDVYALSTIHGHAVKDDLPHKAKLICEYKKYMGCVDHNDQLLAYFALDEKL